MLKSSQAVVFRLKCPSCGKVHRVPEAMLGTTSECPGCSVEIQIPPAPAPAAVPAAGAAPASSPQVTPKEEQPEADVDSIFDGPHVPDSEAAETVVHTTTSFTPASHHTVARSQPPQERDASGNLGLCALILGVLSCAIFWLPIIGYGLPGLGLLVGLAGLVMAIAQKGTGIGTSVAGTALAGIGLSLAISLGPSVMANVAGRNEVAIENQNIQDSQAELATPADPDTAVADGSDASPGPASAAAMANPVAAASASPVAEAEVPAEVPSMPDLPDAKADLPDAKKGVKPPAAVNPAHEQHGPAQKASQTTFHNVSETLRLGKMHVEITSVRIGQVPIFQTLRNRDSLSAKPLLIVWVKITNTNGQKPVDYRGWMSPYGEKNNHTMYAKMTDDRGQSREQVYFASTTVVSNATSEAKIGPHRSIRDAIVFELPGDWVAYLDLRLSASVWKGKGEARFRIPVDMIRRGRE